MMRVCIGSWGCQSEQSVGKLQVIVHSSINLSSVTTLFWAGLQRIPWTPSPRRNTTWMSSKATAAPCTHTFTPRGNLQVLACFWEVDEPPKDWEENFCRLRIKLKTLKLRMWMHDHAAGSKQVVRVTNWLMKQECKIKGSMQIGPTPIRTVSDLVNHNYKPVEMFVAVICK